MATWNGCICLACAARYDEAYDERRRVIAALYNDPCSGVNREKEKDQ